MIKRILHHITAVDHPKLADDRMDEGGHYDNESDVDERTLAVSPAVANVTSSRIDVLSNFTDDPKEARVRDGYDVLHAPVLDIDFPVVVIPSTTPGHFHLYIEKEVCWTDYSMLLDALAECGIIEKGYARASQERGAAYVRVPTAVKPSPDSPEPVAAEIEHF